MERNGDIEKSSSMILQNRLDFVSDGLRPRGKNITAEWKSSKIKLVFLLKDCNTFPNAKDPSKVIRDIRIFENVKGTFLNRIAKLVYAFKKISKTNNYPPYNKINAQEMSDAFNKYPHGYVNIKKKGGGADVKGNVVKEFAKKYKKYTLKEIDMLKPNVIFCGGTFQIAKEYFFKDYRLKKIPKCDRIFYSESKKIIIIDAKHPARNSNYELYEEPLKNFLKAYKQLFDI